MLFLLVSLVVISLAFAGANFLAWKLFDRPRHALLWSAAYALAGVQYTINLIKAQLPSPEFYWISANLVAFALVIFAVWGHRERLGMVSRKAAMLGIFLTMAAVNVVATTGSSPPGLKIALSPTFTFIAMTFIASYLLRTHRQPQLAQRVAAAAHFLFGLTQGAAAVVALGFGAEISPGALQTYHMVNFALMPAFFVAMGISAIFLLATDLSARLTTLSLTDELTQVANRRGFFEASERLLAHSRRTGQPVSLILCDVDHFKAINDRFGHSYGDTTLKKFAAILLQCTRTEDIVGRIGGEEFAIALAGMDAGASRIIAERIRQTLRRAGIPGEISGEELTASFGIAQRTDDSQNVMTLLDAADTALYGAKSGGRDRVVTAPRSNAGSGGEAPAPV